MWMFVALYSLVGIAILQILMVLVNLIRTNGGSFSKKIITILFLSFALFLSGYLFLFIHNMFVFRIAALANLFVFLSAPILFLYFQAIIEKRSSFKAKDFIHLLPFLVVFVIMAYHLRINTERVLEYTDFSIALLATLYIQNIVYLILIIKKLRDEKIALFKIRKSSLSRELRWGTILVKIFAIVILLQLAIFFTREIIHIEFCIVLTGVFFVFTFLVVNTLVLIGLSNSNIFEFRQKYQHTPIRDDVRQDYLERIRKELFEEEMYLDPLISLERLSKKIHIPKNYISQIVNESFQMNFNDLVKKHRIKRAVELINESSGNVVIIDIAYMVGFNSKSTFNAAFKKILHMTPSEYILQQKVLS